VTDHVYIKQHGAAACPLGQAQGARGRRQGAQRRAGGGADHRRSRRAGLRSRQLDRHRGAGRYARNHRGAAAQGDFRDPWLARARKAVRRGGPGGDADELRRLRRLHGDGNGQMGARGEGGRHQGGVMPGPVPFQPRVPDVAQRAARLALLIHSNWLVIVAAIVGSLNVHRLRFFGSDYFCPNQYVLAVHSHENAFIDQPSQLWT
jgi:hypothetical protein